MDRRSQVLSSLRRSREGLTVNELATVLDSHASTLRHHLQLLESEGLIRAVKDSPQGRGRPQLRYVTTSKSVGVGQRDYPLLTSLLLTLVGSDPDAATRARELGQETGRRMALTGVEPIEIWNRMGFDPAVCDDGIDLRHCPYLEAARQSPSVVCALHQGILEGTTPAGITAELRPFSRGGVCHVALTSKG